jgi:hypothetical protein
MSQEFISIKTFASGMEAELARNCLEAEGIQASISSDSKEPGQPFNLVVGAVDVERARSCLDGDSAGAVSAPEEVRPEEFEEAGREFEALRHSELEQKAAGVRSAARLGWIAAALAPVLFLLIANKQIAWRVVMACLFLAVIQFLVWKDARNAEEELKKKNTPGN